MRYLLFMLSCLCGFAQNPADLMATYQILYPSNVAGLYEWFSADVGVYSDNGVTLAVDGGTVQQWQDRSGNLHHIGQATSTKRPFYRTGILNGLPILSAEGTRELTNSFTPTIGQICTIFCVFLYSNKTAQFIADGDVVSTQVGIYTKSLTGELAVQQRNFGEIILEPNFTNTWYVVSFSPETNVFQRSRAYVYSKKVATAQPTSVTEDPQRGTTLFNNQLGNQFLKGCIAEYMFYTRVLTTAERYGIEMYLKQKYALPDPF